MRYQISAGIYARCSRAPELPNALPPPRTEIPRRKESRVDSGVHLTLRVVRLVYSTSTLRVRRRRASHTMSTSAAAAPTAIATIKLPGAPPPADSWATGRTSK